MRREDWDRRYSAVENLWSAKPNRFLVAEVSDLTPGHALDLACGEGQNAIWLATRGWRVVGVDYSEVAIRKARERAARESIEGGFRVADLLDFEPAPAAADLVLVLYLHASAADRSTILARAAAAVAPGGTFLLVGHDLSNMTEGVGGPSDPEVLFTPGDVVSELGGLEIEKAERVYRDVAGADRPAIDALVRARRA